MRPLAAAGLTRGPTQTAAARQSRSAAEAVSREAAWRVAWEGLLDLPSGAGGESG